MMCSPVEAGLETSTRTGLLRKRSASWVISGSLLSWGLEVADRFDLVVFLYLDPEIRMARSVAWSR